MVGIRADAVQGFGNIACHGLVEEVDAVTLNSIL